MPTPELQRVIAETRNQLNALFVEPAFIEEPRSTRRSASQKLTVSDRSVFKSHSEHDGPIAIVLPRQALESGTS